MEDQDLWCYMLESILFAIWISHHSSSGMSLYRMVFNKDPILPFQYVDKQKTHGVNSESDSKIDQSGNIC